MLIINKRNIEWFGLWIGGPQNCRKSDLHVENFGHLSQNLWRLRYEIKCLWFLSPIKKMNAVNHQFGAHISAKTNVVQGVQICNLFRADSLLQLVPPPPPHFHVTSHHALGYVHEMEGVRICNLFRVDTLLQLVPPPPHLHMWVFDQSPRPWVCKWDTENGLIYPPLHTSFKHHMHKLAIMHNLNECKLFRYAKWVQKKRP